MLIAQYQNSFALIPLPSCPHALNLLREVDRYMSKEWEQGNDCLTRRRRSRSGKPVQHLRVCTLEDLLAGGTGGGSDHLIDQIQSQADLFL